MSSGLRRRFRWVAPALAALAIGGCNNPDAPGANRSSQGEQSIGGPGEPSTPPPPSVSSFTTNAVKRTPVDALQSFVSLYVNWSYRTLTGRQRTLAGISVGAARSAELQATASSAADSTLHAAHLANSGTVVSVAEDRTQTGLWVIVTHEQTSGSGDYEGLPGAYHVTLARVAAVAGGYAVSEWLPQT